MNSVIVFLALQFVSVAPENMLQNRDFLISQLQNDSSDLRINAAEKLGELKYPEALSPLADLSRDPVPAVRFAAIRAIARYVNQPALDLLNSAFTNESDPYLKAEVRRSKKSIEDLMKAEAEKADKALKEKDKPAATKKKK